MGTILGRERWIAINVVIIIPALNPQQELVSLVSEITALVSPHIVIVDDGSDAESHRVFESLQARGCDVLAHENNLGKGVAIKTGIRHALATYPDACGIVTADADGQHSAQDILRISQSLNEGATGIILGVRNIRDKEVPFKNRWGNKITSFVFWLKTGLSINDTQTGLRAIPMKYASDMLSAKGTRYEYEMDELLLANKLHIPFIIQPIDTIYFQNNNSSHFRTVRDSVRIYADLLRFGCSSGISAVIDFALFILLCTFVFGHDSTGIILSTVCARVVSGTCNFLINRFIVFRRGGQKAPVKYFALFLIQMFLSAQLTALLAQSLLIAPIAKLLVDVTLFIVSFIVQRKFVFKEKEKGKGKTVEPQAGSKNPVIRFLKRPYVYGVIFTVALSSVFAFTLVDTFMIPKALASVQPSNTSMSAFAKQQASTAADASSTNEGDSQTASSSDATGDGSGGQAAPVVAATSYKDDNIEISIETIREYDTDIYIADITVSNIEYLKAAFAKDTYGRNINETTSVIADRQHAILAINGDFYGFRDDGWVLRNGVLYRKGTSDTSLLMDMHGNLSLESNNASIASLAPQLWQVWTFGPALVSDGEIAVTKNQEISGNSMNSNPRTAIGQVGDLHYVFIVSDGRTNQSAGLSLYELASLFKERGCSVAYNLDGGGSSTLYFNGEVLNTPTTDGRTIVEREVSDIVYIGY